MQKPLASPITARWRVEVEVDPGAVVAIVGAAEMPTELRAGFSVEVAVEERSETLLRTAARWVRARADDRVARRGISQGSRD